MMPRHPLGPAADDNVRAVCERRALCFGRKLLVQGSGVASAEQLTEEAEAERADGQQPCFPL